MSGGHHRQLAAWARGGLSFSLLLSVGCGGQGGRPNDGGVPDDAGAVADLVGCKGNPDAGPCVSHVTGQVVDESGAPLANTFVTFCGRSCFNGNADGNGRFDVPVDQYLEVGRYAMHVHGRPDHVDYYAPLPPASGGAIDYPTPLVVPKLPASGPLLAMDGSAQKVIQGEATIELAAGTTISLSLEDDGDAGRQFRAVRIADPKTMPFIDPGAPPALLYVFSPFEADFSAKVRLGFDNVTQLPAGTTLEVYSMRGIDLENPPATTLDRVGTARVTSDGKRIELDSGDGTKRLTWIALRRAP